MKGNWKVTFFRGNVVKEDSEVSVYVHTEAIHKGRSHKKHEQ